jgi:Tol biopolymer transport system component
MLTLTACGLASHAVVAQRAPVLKQVRVPHSYYYREMYLPQVTSGPNAVTWSPDGRDVVYAMAGTLWRQRLGTGVAEQLTDAASYDHQPDWSPDGRYIAYSAYRNDAIDLMMLDLTTGISRPILENGAVQVDARWSRDGKRIAFVSTRHEGRWHVYTALVTDGGLGTVERVTTDQDSQLPRYYYSKFDHYLSPTWSPDGWELLIVSNRGRIWGTGGFWRMDARPGAEPRQIHYEETTWKARPDWSPDGRRVVFSSYLGGQWHQLWLMPAGGGDTFPLTYGSFDATSPRWSPDGGRIAYISNEHGNTSLWIVHLPGGRRERVDIQERRFRNPVGRLRISVVDRATGRPLPARVSVVGPDGRGYSPDDAWRHADDEFDRRERRFEHSYFHTDGTSELSVPATSLQVEVTHGLEYRVARHSVAVAPKSAAALVVALDRLADFRSAGWMSGDLHVHMNYGGAYRNTPAHLARQAAAEDLAVVENLIVNKEQRIPDIGYFTGRPDVQSDRSVVINHGQEFHTSYWGHTGLLGLRDHLVLPDYAGYTNTAAASLYPHNAVVSDLARAQGGLMGYVHPFSDEPDPADANQPLTDELPVDVALGKVDYLEVVGFSDPMATANVWYRLLNCGFRIPAAAGTDAMANFASLRGPVGLNRTYVKSGAPIDYAAWLNGIRAGRTFATNGPLLEFTVDGREPGDEIRVPRGGRRLQARASLRSIVPIDALEVVANGRVVETLPLSADRTTATIDRMLSVERSGWYTLRARSLTGRHPILDRYAFATTSPIYVIVGDDPIRSTTDARYFLAWIGRLEQAVAEHQAWNGPDEKRAVLESLERARSVYQERAHESEPQGRR